MYAEKLALRLQAKREELDRKLNAIEQEMRDVQHDSILVQQRCETINDIAQLEETLELLTVDNHIQFPNT